MHQMLQTIINQGVPVDSELSAAQHLGLNGLGQMSDDEYRTRISDITDGETLATTDSYMLRITYSYLVTETIRESSHTDVLDKQSILGEAIYKADKLVRANPWMDAARDTPAKLDGAGNVKPKKGAKKELAKKVYAEFIEGKITSRQEAMQVLVDKVGMTINGASTYYAQLKKGTL